MASTGTQTTWSSNGGFYLKIVWDITSQSVANNRSGVRVRMYLGAKSGWSLSDSSNSWTLSVGGNNFSGSNVSININGSEKLITEEQVSIDHNADGTKSISINGYIGALYFGAIDPGSFTASLNAIPRASTISSTATLNAENNSNIGITRYSSSFSHTLDIYLTKSGVADKLIKQLSYSSSVTSKSTSWDSDDRYEMFRYGHGYWTGTRLVLKTYSGGSLVGTTEKTGSFGYPSNNSVGSISNFTLGSAAPVSISKASDLYSHQIEVRIGSTVIGSQAISTGTSFSVPINTTTVLNSITTSKTGTAVLWIKTFLATNTSVVIRDWTSEASATVTIPASYAPSFAATQFTFADTNTSTVNITGNNQTLVSGLSTLQVNINTAATATTGASIVSYQVSAGNKSGSRANIGAVALGAINTSSSSVNITVTATDSRGYQTSATKTATVIPYSKPTVVGNATRNGGFEETTVLRTSGVVSRLVVGGVSKNNITSLQYRTKLSTASWVDTWEPIPFTAPTGTNTTYTASNVTLTIPSLEAWNIEVKATDTMGSITSVIYTVPAGVPLVFMDTTLNSIGVNMFPTISNGLQVGGVAEFKSNVTAKKLLVSNITGVGDQLDDLEVQSNFGDFKTFTRASVVGNNESSIQIRPKDDLNTGLQIFSRKDSTGFWDIKDGITWLRYNQAGGNGTATGDITLTPGVSSGKIKLNAVGGVECASRLSANLTHMGGYLIVETFSPSYGAGQAEVWYRGDERKLTISSRNPGDSSAQVAKVFADRFSAVAYEAPSTSTPGYLQCGSSQEYRVTEFKSSTNYRPIRASSFPTGSSIKYKTNLEDIDTRVDALELIKETDIWHYHLKSNLEGGIYDKPKVGVIAEMVNPLIRDEDGVDSYSMVSLAWKAIQQQDEKIQVQQTEIEDLKEQNQALWAMLGEMQSRLDTLEQS